MPRTVPKGALKLAFASAAIAAAWLVVLPRIARHPAERESWEVLRNAGIDPSAMYYSELEAMEPILEQLNRGERSKLWSRQGPVHGARNP